MKAAVSNDDIPIPAKNNTQLTSTANEKED
jgi:hypothetical protein